MSRSAPRSIGPLADTQYDIDTREAPRHGCASRPLLRVMVRPNFIVVRVIVCDISTKGIGLICEAPIQPGAQLAILWDFGPPQQWRTLRARVARATPSPRGGWVIGCAFEQRLQAVDLQAFFETSPHLAAAGRWR